MTGTPQITTNIGDIAIKPLKDGVLGIVQALQGGQETEIKGSVANLVLGFYDPSYLRYVESLGKLSFASGREHTDDFLLACIVTIETGIREIAKMARHGEAGSDNFLYHLGRVDSALDVLAVSSDFVDGKYLKGINNPRK